MSHRLEITALAAVCVLSACHHGDNTTTSAARDSAATTASSTPAPQTATTPDSSAAAPASAPSGTTTGAATPTTGTTTGSTGSTTGSDQPPPLRDAYHTAPLDTVNAKVYAGWKYYNLNCSRCHGEDVLGTTIAPHLIVSLKPNGPIPDEGTFLATVCGGREAKGMPAWCKIGLSTAQIDTIYSYVKGRSDAKLHPGRPALR